MKLSAFNYCFRDFNGDMSSQQLKKWLLCGLRASSIFKDKLMDQQENEMHNCVNIGPAFLFAHGLTSLNSTVVAVFPQI